MVTLFSFQLHADTIVFDHVNVIPMVKNEVLYDQRVIVVNGTITAIEPATSKLTVKADRVIDSKNQFMIPGLSDTHYHQTGSTIEENELQYKLLIANGVTSVLSMGEWSGQDTIAIRQRANHKTALAPFYKTVGPQVEGYKVKTPEAAIETVNFHKERGYDFIKIHSNLPKDAYLTLLEEAEKAGIPVIGHTQRDKPLELSLRLTKIVHVEDIFMVFSDENNLKINDIDQQLAKSIASQVKDSGIYVAPTLSTVSMIPDFTNPKRYKALKARDINKYLPKSVFDWWTGPKGSYQQEFFTTPLGLDYIDRVIKGVHQLTLALHKADVPLLVGSDNFGMQITGFSVHEEMQMMQDAGIPAFDVLRAATVTSARFLERHATTGTINEGKNAEFIILNKNPLEDIRNTRSITGVMLKGQWLNRKQIDDMLLQVELAHASQ